MTEGRVPEARRDDLLAESHALHRALFGGDAPAELAKRYVDAHAFQLRRVTEVEQAWMKSVVSRRADLEALEVALRLSGADHVLTRKAKVLVCLAEASPEYDRTFVNREDATARALVALAVAAVRTASKAVKGAILLRVNG